MGLGFADTRMNPWFLLAVRIVVAGTWFYQGLWLKVIATDPHHLAVVQSVGGPIPPLLFLNVIGIGETLLGLAVLAGVWHRFIAGFQVALLSAMNTLGILFGGSAIEQPVGLIIQNLPFLICVILLGTYGPGALSLRRAGK
jgi:uncharacterized membrane protein YphA (DoxX/SURF4 family)